MRFYFFPLHRRHLGHLRSAPSPPPYILSKFLQLRGEDIKGGEILIQHAGGEEEETCASGEACGSECGGVGPDFGDVRIQWSVVDGRHDVDAPPSDG